VKKEKEVSLWGRGGEGDLRIMRRAGAEGLSPTTSKKAGSYFKKNESFEQ